jgi:hypothetical protein
VVAAALAVTDREDAAPAGADEVWIGGWPTTVGVLVEGTLTVGTLGEGTLTVGTLAPGTLAPGTLTPGTLTPATRTPGTLRPGMLTPGTATVGTATADGAPGAETVPAAALTEAPSAAPQRPAVRVFTVVCSRLRRSVGMFSHRALPSDTPPANAPASEPYCLLVASTVVLG